MSAETVLRFDCFGGSCGVYVEGDGGDESAAQAATRVRTSLLLWHRRFSRFEQASELSRLNADPRERVPVSPLMARLAVTIREAAEITGGLVDATLLPELVAAGYEPSCRPCSRPPWLWRWRRPVALRARRRSGAGSRSSRKREPSAARRGSCSTAAGSPRASSQTSWPARFGATGASRSTARGDLAIGGTGAVERRIEVESPLDGSVLHTFPRCATAASPPAASSGVAGSAPTVARPPPARSRDRTPRVQRRGPGNRARSERLARRDPREGGGAERPRRRAPLAAMGRRGRPRRPHARGDRARGIHRRRGRSPPLARLARRLGPAGGAPEHRPAAGAQLRSAQPEGGGELRCQLLGRQRP